MNNLALAQHSLELMRTAEGEAFSDVMDSLSEILTNILEYPVEITHNGDEFVISVEYGEQDQYGYTKGTIMGVRGISFAGVDTPEKLLKVLSAIADRIGRIIRGRTLDGKGLDYTGKDGKIW